MADIIIAHLTVCVLVGFGSVLVAWGVLWRRYKFLMSPLGFQITLLGVYMAALGIPGVEEINSVWLATMGPQLIFFISLLAVLSVGAPANTVAADVIESRARIARDPLMIWFFVVLAVFVVLYYFISLLGSGFSLEKNGLEGRAVVASQSRILFYVFVMAPLFLSVGIHLFRGLMQWLSVALAIVTSAISLLAGSKGGLLSLSVIAVSCFYLRWLDGEISDRQGRAIQLRMMWIVSAAVLVTPVIIFTSGTAAGLLAILARFLSGFDMIIYLGLTYDSIDQIQKIYAGEHLSALSFILATPMKILGIYNQPFDSMSKFLWDVVLGFPEIENLPNDNLFVTLSIGVSPLFSAGVALVLPLILGALYNTLMKSRYDTCFNLLAFWWLSGSFVSCILSPQLSISSLLAAGVVYAAAASLAFLTKMFSREDRRV